MDIYQKTYRFYKKAKGEKRIIGNSILGRDIYAVKIGDGYPVGIVQYALHGREYITATLAFLHAKVGVFKGSMWLIPLANPDGALLSEKGISSVKDERIKERLLSLNGKKDFSLWKANARGVDLNVNFDAEWGKGKKNVRFPGGENYVGESPFSESETQALKNFTEEIQPDYTVSYHTKGEEIYWQFNQSVRTCIRDKRLAETLSLSTGYVLACAKGSVGGYKDWCIEKLQIPAFTIEAGRDECVHPLTKKTFQDALYKNRRALWDLSKEF